MSKTQWGNATWFLFHTLAEKLRPEYSSDVPVLINYFRGISSNLPCPTCSEHAAQNLRALNPRYVTNTHQLKRFLFTFHNKVNEQLRKPKFSEFQCQQKYYYSNTRNIILNFKRIMSIPRGNPKLMIGGHHRLDYVNGLLQWLQGNLYKFNP